MKKFVKESLNEWFDYENNISSEPINPQEKANKLDQKYSTLKNKIFPGRKKATTGVIDTEFEKILIDLEALNKNPELKTSGIGANPKRREIYVAFEIDGEELELNHILQFNGDFYTEYYSDKPEFIGNIYKEPKVISKYFDDTIEYVA